MAKTVLYWVLGGWVWMGLGITAIPDVWATTIYSYIDDQGNLASTDRMDTIPEKYRANVKVHESPDPVPRPPSKIESVQQAVRERMKNVGVTMPSVGSGILGGIPTMEGFTPDQSKMLTYAGLAAVALLVMMYISKGPFVRLLGIALLVMIGIGVPVLLYVGDNGPADRMKQKATSAGQAQQDRLPQTP